MGTTSSGDFQNASAEDCRKCDHYSSAYSPVPDLLVVNSGKYFLLDAKRPPRI